MLPIDFDIKYFDKLKTDFARENQSIMACARARRRSTPRSDILAVQTIESLASGHCIGPSRLNCTNYIVLLEQLIAIEQLPN
jgi:hypothetical protein